MATVTQTGLPSSPPAPINLQRGALNEGVGGTIFAAPLMETMTVLPRLEYITLAQAGSSASSFTNTHTSYPCWVNGTLGEQYVVAGVSAQYTTASSSLTLQVEVQTATGAVGSGTNQLTATMDLHTTAGPVTVNGTVIANPTVIAVGQKVDVVFGGSETSLAGCVINILLQRVS